MNAIFEQDVNNVVAEMALAFHLLVVFTVERDVCWHVEHYFKAVPLSVDWVGACTVICVPSPPLVSTNKDRLESVWRYTFCAKTSRVTGVVPQLNLIAKKRKELFKCWATLDYWKTRLMVLASERRVTYRFCTGHLRWAVLVYNITHRIWSVALAVCSLMPLNHW